MWENGGAGSTRLMASLRRGAGGGEPVGEHPAEVPEELLPLTGRQVLPPGFGRRGQARGGSGRVDRTRCGSSGAGTKLLTEVGELKQGPRACGHRCCIRPDNACVERRLPSDLS